jgi:hypothetical protein
VVTQAVVALARAAVASRLDPAGDEAHQADAHRRLDELGLEAIGWRAVFDAALAASPAAV